MVIARSATRNGRHAVTGEPGDIFPIDGGAGRSATRASTEFVAALALEH